MKKIYLILIITSLISCGKEKIEDNAPIKNIPSTNFTLLSENLQLIVDLIDKEIKINPKNALIYTNQLIQIAQKEKDKRGEAHGYYKRAYIQDQYLNEYAKALPDYFEALKIYQGIKIQKAISSCYLAMSDIYYKLEFYDKALIHYQQLIENTKQIHNKKDEANAYRGIALVYRATEDYIRSIFYLEKCLSIQQELNNEIEIGNCYNSLASTYYIAGNYQKSNSYYLQAATLFKLNNKNQELGNVYYNLGLLHVEMKELVAAKTYFNQCLNIGNTYQYSDLISSAELQLGKLAAGAHNYKKAMNHGVAAWKTAQLQNDLATLKTTSLFLSNLYESVGNSKQALAYLKESNKWKDTYQMQQASLHNQLEDQRLAVTNWQTSLESNQKSFSPRKGWIAAIGMLLFLTGNSYFFYWLREKRRVNKEQAKKKMEEYRRSLLKKWEPYQIINIEEELTKLKETIECLEASGDKKSPLFDNLKEHMKKISWYSRLSTSKPPIKN